MESPSENTDEGHQSIEERAIIKNKTLIFCVSLLVTLLISGWYDCKHTLFQCVAYYAWKAKAIEKNYFNEPTFLEIRYYNILEINGAVHSANQMLMGGFAAQMVARNTEVGEGDEAGFSVIDLITKKPPS